MVGGEGKSVIKVGIFKYVFTGTTTTYLTAFMKIQLLELSTY